MAMTRTRTSDVAMITTESMSMSNSKLYLAGRDQYNVHNYISSDAGSKLDESKFIVTFLSYITDRTKRSSCYLALALSAQL
jgi:hypothetical protein